MIATTRWRIPPVAYVPIGLAIGAEAISNGLRAYGLGENLEAFTVSVLGVPISLAGGVLVMAAAAVSVSQARAAWVMCAPGPWQRRAIGALFTALLVTVSVTALRSHIQDAERAKIGEQTKATNDYKNAKGAYDRALAEYEKVKDAATPASVQARMDAIPVDASIRKKTNNCTDVTREASRRECAPVTAMAPALADANRKAELELQLPMLKADLDRQHRPEETTEAEADVVSFWGWLMGLGVVLLATFGAVLFAESEVVSEPETVSEEAPRSVPASPEIPKSVPPTPRKGRGGRKADDKIVNFTQAFERAHGRRPSGSEIRAYFPELPQSTAYDYAKRTG